MDPGARADRLPDRISHPRGHDQRLALRAAALGAAWAAGAALAPGAARAQTPATPAYVWQLPRGFPVPAVPADNPMSDAKVALGARLFFDPQLSVTGAYSCASCHDPQRSFADDRPRAIGATGGQLPHNALALVNVAYNVSFGWDTPRVRSLETQMLLPLLNEHPVELGVRGREEALCARLAADPGYAAAFAAAFPGTAPAVSFDTLVKAIAAFERTLISGGSAFDAYVFGGDHAALNAEAKAGMALFFSARVGCAGCHSGFNFAGNWRDAQGATGPASFARNGTSAQPLRVPTLRNIALTAPYMHDGRFATLAQVLEHYSGLAERAGGAARIDRRLPHAPLAQAERVELKAFLESLTDPGFIGRSSAGDRQAAGRLP